MNTTTFTVNKPMVLSGTLLSPGATWEMNDISEWEHITFIPGPIRSAVMEKTLKDNGDNTYTVNENVFLWAGQTFKVGQVFSVRPITDEGWTPVQPRAWIKRLTDDGVISIEEIEPVRKSSEIVGPMPSNVVITPESNNLSVGTGIVTFKVRVDGKVYKTAKLKESLASGVLTEVGKLSIKNVTHGQYQLGVMSSEPGEGSVDIVLDIDGSDHLVTLTAKVS